MNMLKSKHKSNIRNFGVAESKQTVKTNIFAQKNSNEYFFMKSIKINIFERLSKISRNIHP